MTTMAPQNTQYPFSVGDGGGWGRTFQPPVPYGHAEYTGKLPPPLPGEECLPLELILLIRDGKRSLEAEDYLVREILLYLQQFGGPRIENGPPPYEYPLGVDPIFWQVPAPEDENAPAQWWHDRGYELMFKTADGKPVPVIVIDRSRNTETVEGRRRFVKHVPVVEFPVRQFACPLTPESALSEELYTYGYEHCDVELFANMGEWQRHISTAHPDLATHLTRVYGPSWKELEDRVVAEAQERVRARRALDPRIAAPARWAVGESEENGDGTAEPPGLA